MPGDGQDRSQLDALLRDVSATGDGQRTSGHHRQDGHEGRAASDPETWLGLQTRIYRTVDELKQEFPTVLGAGTPRVLKPSRGNGGIGGRSSSAPLTRTRRLRCASARRSPARRSDGGHAVASVCRVVYASLRRGRRRPVDRPAVSAPHYRGHHPLLRRQGRGGGLRPAASERTGPGCDPTARRIFGLPAQKTMFTPDEPPLSVLRQRVEWSGYPPCRSSLTLIPHRCPCSGTPTSCSDPRPHPRGHLRPVRDQCQFGAAVPAGSAGQAGSGHARRTSGLGAERFAPPAYRDGPRGL